MWSPVPSRLHWICLQFQRDHQCPNCRQVEDGEWLYASGCCRYYEEEAIHRNFVYAQDADQSYQPAVWWLQESIPVFYGEAVCLIRKQSPSTA
ncbi:unnamed protein product [Sphagnum troendelagicum]|uniref:Uncharacterized protein n=1 Tax=Sphagnum troendelagicum TaxID=128251 RepID=A0ABP0TGC7_9BRYO